MGWFEENTGWCMWKQDGVCGNRMVYVETGWYMWKRDGVCGNGMVYVETGWCM